jgi:hypothetical protein
MPIRNAIVSMVFALSAAGIATNVHAQGGMEKVEKAYKEGPCSNDLKKFCARVKPGEGRVAKCMADNFRKLEPACQGTVQTALNKRGSMVKACKADTEKFCKGIRPREGRILSCLKQRESDLSPACASEFKRAFSDPTVAQ